MMGGYYKGQIPEEDVPVGENGYDAPSNVGIIIIGLLYGEGDFGRSICLATNCGEDTDCTAGSLGALLGIISGKSNLPEKWVKGCSDEISTWCLRIDAALRLPKTVSEFAERIIRQTPVVLTDYCDFRRKTDLCWRRRINWSVATTFGLLIGIRSKAFSPKYPMPRATALFCMTS